MIEPNMANYKPPKYASNETYKTADDLLSENLKLRELVKLQESLLGNIQATINTGDYFDRLSWPDLRAAITAAKKALE